MRALFLLLGIVPLACQAATASGRNWRIAVERLECRAAQLSLGVRIDYLGPKGVVEAPVPQVVDASGRSYAARSLVWKGGERKLARWLSSGGLANVQTAAIGEFELKFDLGETIGEIRLEFGDIAAFALTRKGGCASVLKPAELQAPRKARPAQNKPPAFRVYRAAYPCGSARTVEADHPPYAPLQLLVFGRGFLPNARQIELPEGKAPAQPYAYSGADELKSIEDAARRAIAADFPRYLEGIEARKYFAFNWGSQKLPSGNEAYAIAIYPFRACKP